MARPSRKTPSKSKTARAPGGDRVSETRVQHTDSAPEIDVTPSRIAAVRARLAPISTAEIAALDETHSDVECIAAGGETQSASVQHDGLLFLLVGEEEIRKRARSINCSPLYLSYLNHHLEALESARADRRASAPGDPVGRRRRDEQAARVERNELLRVLRLVAGGDQAARDEVEAAAGRAETGADVRAALGALLPIGYRWMGERGGARRVRVDTFGLTAELVERAARAHRALGESSVDAVGNSKSERDTPAVNLAEGRVLYAMKVLYEVFESAHARNPLVRRLVPGAGTRKFIVGHAHSKAGGAGGEPAAAGAAAG